MGHGAVASEVFLTLALMERWGQRAAGWGQHGKEKM